MVIDSSAALAIILQTPTGEARNPVDVGNKLRGNRPENGFLKGTLGLPEIELFVMRANIKLVAVDEQQA